MFVSVTFHLGSCNHERSQLDASKKLGELKPSVFSVAQREWEEIAGCSLGTCHQQYFIQEWPLNSHLSIHSEPETNFLRLIHPTGLGCYVLTSVELINSSYKG
jgi:hypothetical protein